MADHSELMTEMSYVEKMSTQERLKHAKKRRLQQLKKYSQREKEYNSKKKKTDLNMNKKTKRVEYKVHFVPSVMLLEAASRNDVNEVRRLLMLGVSPDSTNDDGLTALHQCCIDDSEDMLKLLIEFGADVNAQDSEQWTPLHAASTCGHLHLVKYLINQGANLLAVNADGNMPYDICEDDTTLDYIESEMAKRGITQELIDETRAATEVQMLEDLKIIAENSGDLEFRDHQNATPLHVGAANGYINVVEFLLDHHVSTEICDNDMWKPIHAAACWGHPDILEILVQNGADLSSRTKNGETPYDICEDFDLKERILQLKNEVEIKKQTQTHKLKRSQSQNTRSHSIRRTSIREKSQISRREAREEAKLWQSKHSQEKSQVELLEDIIKSQKDCESVKSRVTSSDDGKENSNPLSVDDIDLTLAIDDSKVQNGISGKESLNNAKLKKSQQISSSVLKTHDNNELSQATNQPVASEKTLATDKPSIASDNLHRDNHQVLSKVNDNSLVPKIEESAPQDGQRVQHNMASKDLKLDVSIHVTVNASPPSSASSFIPGPGTLADLKRQRSDYRSRNNSLSSQDISLTTNQHVSSPVSTYSYNLPPSPNSSLRKFTSDPSEVVGDTSKTGCCTIM